MPPRARALRTTAILLAFVGASCDDRPAPGPAPVHPVSGRVTYKGEAVPEALVVFHAPDGAGGDAPEGPPRPTGRTDAGGVFRLHTYVGDDGAPAGEYQVTVSAARPSEAQNVMAKTTPATRNVTLPLRYADPSRSGLTATVKPGANTIPPFNLD